MKKFNKIILLVALIFIQFNLEAQRGREQGRPGGRGDVKLTITGSVLDADSNTPLEFATISLFSKRDSSLLSGGLTGPDGTFSITTRPGPQFAVIEYISYENKVVDVPFDRDQMKKGITKLELGAISLAVAGVALDDVVIRAEKSETQFSLDKRVFNVGKDLANQGGSAQDILDNVPSVTVDLEGAVSLRGSAGVRILIDGKPSGLANQDNANGLRSIPANLI